VLFLCNARLLLGIHLPIGKKTPDFLKKSVGWGKVVPMDRIPESNRNQHNREGWGSWVGRLWGRVVEAVDVSQRGIAQATDAYHGQHPTDSKGLLERTLSLPNYLSECDFDTLKEIAENVQQELSSERFVLSTFKTYCSLIELDYSKFSEDERCSLQATLDKCDHGEMITAAKSVLESGSAGARAEAAELLLDLAGSGEEAVSGIIDAAKQVLKSGAEGAKSEAKELLLRLARLEEVAVLGRINAAQSVLMYGTEGARAEA